MKLHTFRDPSFALRAFYALCLAGAGYNHAMMNLAHGLAWDYGGVPLGSSMFWTSLTLLDPLAALLLFVRPRPGVALTVAIIVIDVVHNSWLSHYLGVRPSIEYVAQVAFLVFVLLTAKTAWRVQYQIPGTKPQI